MCFEQSKECPEEIAQITLRYFRRRLRECAAVFTFLFVLILPDVILLYQNNFPRLSRVSEFQILQKYMPKSFDPPALFPPPSLSTAGSGALTFLPVLLKWGLGQWESGTLTVHPPPNLCCLHIFPLWTFSFRLKWGLSKRWLALIKRALHPSNNWWQTHEWKVLYEHRRENETWNRSGKESGISGEELLFVFSGLQLRELKTFRAHCVIRFKAGELLRKK